MLNFDLLKKGTITRYHFIVYYYLMKNCSELVLFLHYSSNNMDFSKCQSVTLWNKFTIQILVNFVWFCQLLVLQVNPHSKFCFNVFSWCLSFGFCSATVFYVLCFFHHSVLISINSCGLSVHFSVFLPLMLV